MSGHCDVSYVLVSYVANSYDDGTRWDVYGHEAPAVNDKMGSFTTEKNALVFAHSHGLPVVKGGMDTYHGTIGKLCNEVHSKLEAALRDHGLADKVISGAHESTHEAADPDFCGVCESRRDGVNEYRARLLAKIEAKETT